MAERAGRGYEATSQCVGMQTDKHWYSSDFFFFFYLFSLGSPSGHLPPSDRLWKHLHRYPKVSPQMPLSSQSNWQRWLSMVGGVWDESCVGRWLQRGSITDIVKMTRWHGLWGQTSLGGCDLGPEGGEERGLVMVSRTGKEWIARPHIELTGSLVLRETTGWSDVLISFCAPTNGLLLLLWEWTWGKRRLWQVREWLETEDAEKK